MHFVGRCLLASRRSAAIVGLPACRPTWSHFLCSQRELEREQILDNMRYFLEECDKLQAAQCLVDFDSGFGSVACDVLQELKDECRTLPVVCFPTCEAIPSAVGLEGSALHKARLRTAKHHVNFGIALTQLAEASSVMAPLAVPSSSPWAQGGGDPAGLLASLFDAATLHYHNSDSFEGGRGAAGSAAASSSAGSGGAGGGSRSGTLRSQRAYDVLAALRVSDGMPLCTVAGFTGAQSIVAEDLRQLLATGGATIVERRGGQRASSSSSSPRPPPPVLRLLESFTPHVAPPSLGLRRTGAILSARWSADDAGVPAMGDAEGQRALAGLLPCDARRPPLVSYGEVVQPYPIAIPAAYYGGAGMAGDEAGDGGADAAGFAEESKGGVLASAAAAAAPAAGGTDDDRPAVATVVSVEASANAAQLLSQVTAMFKRRSPRVLFQYHETGMEADLLEEIEQTLAAELERAEELT